jgi:DNA polymerase-1
MSDRTLLVDGDILLYKTSFANQFNVAWGEELSSQVVDLEHAIFTFDTFVQRILQASEALDILLIFSGSINYRYSVLQSYKHNRKTTEKPLLYNDMKNYALKTYPHKIKEPLEADDVLGIMTTLKPDKYILATIDKDLLQIPGVHFDWRDDKMFIVTEEEGDFWFYRQVLTGDPTDGYQGCPGIGPTKAERILHSTPKEKWWETVVETYIQRGSTEKDALTQARVARILRACDYDFKRKEVKLWTPVVAA